MFKVNIHVLHFFNKISDFSVSFSIYHIFYVCIEKKKRFNKKYLLFAFKYSNIVFNLINCMDFKLN